MMQSTSEFKISDKAIVLFLGIIISMGIIFRLAFSHFELPLNSDNLQYFLYAIDHSLGETTDSFKIHNVGWPLFLSFFFKIFGSENFMDYMILQKIISIVISSLTAIPVYFLVKRFFSKEYAILGSLLFVFEPRIVQNSTFGISDPLYIIGITVAIVLLLNTRKNFEFLAFAVLGFSIGVRSEGLFLIPAFVVVYFLQRKISKKSMIRVLISLLIISTVLVIISYHNNIENKNNGLFSKVDSGIKEIYASPETKLSGGPINLLIDGFTNFVKFLGWSQFPIWMVFVPVGLLVLLRVKNQNTAIILTLAFFISLPTLYAFSFTNDTRYLFPLYPIYSVLSLYFLVRLIQNKKKFLIILFAIVIGLALSSTMFLIWKDIDVEKEFQMYELIKEISNKEKVFNNFGYELSYRIPVALENTPVFPITSSEILQATMKIANISRVNSLNEFMEAGAKEQLTHLVIKENNSYLFLDDIFENENNYNFLTKEYDSMEKGHKIHVKIFRIDYEKYSTWKTDRLN